MLIPRPARLIPVVLSIASVMVACQGDLPTSTVPHVQASISQQTGSSTGFYFLPPLVKQPAYSGTFDPSLAAHAKVEVCDPTTSSCNALPAVNVKDDHYAVSWHTRDYPLAAGKHYRLRVSVARAVLGSADVWLMRNASESKSVPEGYSPVVLGQTVPIRFRIERGAVQVVDPNGGTVAAAGGSVTLVFPANALSGNTGVTADPILDYPQSEQFPVIAGTAFELGPDGSTFAQPVQLTIAYNPALLPAGVPEETLRIHKLVNGVWQPVPGGTVDVTGNTASAPLSGFSPYAIVGSRPAILATQPYGLFSGTSRVVLTGAGTANVTDQSFTASQWSSAGRAFFPMKTPAGIVTATVYVMNDNQNLYVAVRFPRNTIDKATVLNFIADADNDGINVAGDDAFQYYGSGSLLGFKDQHAVACGQNVCGQNDPSSNDGAGSFYNDGTTSTFEVSHPLNSADDQHDFSLGARSRIGFKLLLDILDAQNTSYFTAYPPNANTTITFGTIVIQNDPFPPVMAGAGSATTDAVLDATEWKDAACVYQGINLPGGGSTPGQICFMNDGTTVFAGVKFARAAADPVTELQVAFDSNLSGEIGPGDDLVIASSVSAGLRDWSLVSTSFPCEFSGMVFCYALDATPDGASSFANNGQFTTIEISHPRSSTDAGDVKFVSNTPMRFRAVIKIVDGNGVVAYTMFPQKPALMLNPPPGQWLMK